MPFSGGFLSSMASGAIYQTASYLLSHDLQSLAEEGNAAGLGLLIGGVSEVPGIDQEDLMQKGQAMVQAVRQGRVNQASAMRSNLVSELRSLLVASRLFKQKTDESLPPLRENGIPQETDLETGAISPEGYLDLVAKEFGRVTERYGVVEASLSPTIREGYTKEMGLIQERLKFWEGEIAQFKTQHGKERDQYREDIILGERILLDRVLNLGASIYSEPVEEKFLSGIGLRESIHPPTAPKLSIKKGVKRAILDALINHDVGYGRALHLRAHQVMTLNKVKGVLKMQQEQLKENEKLAEQLLVGTIVMPTGGGKTRVMVASFAAAMELGLFKLGDKFIILNHTEQIHEQNLKVVRLLSPYFKRRFGRRLRVTEYKAEDKNLRGDVVVVSIPSVNTLEKRERFEKELRKALGQSGKLAMIAVDEIHHLEISPHTSKESWKELIRTLREVSPNFYRIGFTATPTGKEGPYIVRIAEHVLMQSGVTPRTYLVKVPGIDLSQLKISKSANDFQTRELVSTLLDYPERNQRLFEALEKSGLRRPDKSPSGKEALEAVLTFAADLRHAKMMAKGYVDYFGQEGEGLRKRNLTMIGGERGHIGRKELEKSLEAYKQGEIDGVIAIVSGETKKEIREKILSAVEKGEVEAVFNVDVWLEGADLYMFTHLLGSRPTFSRFKKGQERGRLNRRGPKEVSRRGELLLDKPKIIFEILDRYHSMDRALMFYGDLMGVAGHTQAKPGELFDAMSGEVVSEIDREGQKVEHKDLGELLPTRRRLAKPAQAELQKPLVAKLWEVLENRYGEDVETMAIDLGLPVEEMEAILQGKGWVNARWFLRRLATLLYQDRDIFVELYNEERGLGGEAVTPADIAIVQGALAFYEKWEGTIKGELVIQQVTITRTSLQSLSRGVLGEIQWRNIWRGMALYFGVRAEQQGEKQAKAKDEYERLMKYLFDREGWSLSAKTAKERLLLEARRAVALKFGGVLPNRPGLEGVSGQNVQSPLRRWFKGEEVRFSRGYTTHDFFTQVRSLLVGLGRKAQEVDDWIVDAVFESQDWSHSAKTAQEQLLLEARRAVALKFGGVLTNRPGLEGVSVQLAHSPLTRWLQGEEIRFSQSNTADSFYSQVGSLLVGLGRKAQEVEEWIVGAVFESQGWNTSAKTAQEQLLLEARRAVALKFGGVLPRNPGLDGVLMQEARSYLTRWLKGEGVRFSKGHTADNFYNQVRSLLVGLGRKAQEVDDWIVDAVFESQGWSLSTKTAKERLLLEARRAVALKFSGVLPRKTELDGVLQQDDRSPLTRWLQGEEIRFSTRHTADHFYAQVRSLLVGLGKGDQADPLIQAVKTSH
ncbi:MAG: hypothetical protein A2979_02485 [Deltaproteobacteria bacterium RIFCSPLOWO2_01_FULL_45_74]|nr:MAG: hypothetical protein A2712_06755 [Deltaproteobacteria bacterium RIFCSPHIGHO2_01_FULL_43_49]OGQ15650.1 MAG: hypothetical protein A3D22_05545 [Deltaproteobacteria bacterium RIFCSPHIGHO2_02_FULL_44_53]OGQ28619.1 MAG: hypothetical protein A3D98_00280 [Deltaproteobacteria bacterium RIFCSPHIGHO2_12_FULL_44_21]OGQ31941.1 MAG: hypothetical protein A2979_02485 [Deltaproteobacteria bacterium RIFCSPLOWO2_01_FULL_45_74]OGQ43557.1 MAG: hypothetical protein A3I70_03010 [Deltaproteobacteria bacterium 